MHFFLFLLMNLVTYCRIPKSNDNGKYKREIEREEENVEARVFSLLYSLYDIFWMITMCCEVSFLYIGLLIQLSYLTYVGFLNIPPQTQGVILMKPLSLLTKE